MPFKTFTVLVVEAYEDDIPEDEAAIAELADSLQDACDNGLLCSRFRVVSIADGWDPRIDGDD